MISWRPANHRIHKGCCIIVTIRREIYASQNRLWSAGFEPLLRSIPTTNDDILSARILKLRSLALMVDLADSLSSTELLYDSYFLEFEGIITLAKPSLIASTLLQNPYRRLVQSDFRTYLPLTTSCGPMLTPPPSQAQPSRRWNRSSGERAHGLHSRP
jgi:hypothetical protein